METNRAAQDTGKFATSEPGTRGGLRVPSFVRVAVVIVLTFGGYQLAMAGVRAWVDHRIASVEGDAVVEFELADLQGRVWTAAELRGRHVALHFFRSRCSSCLAERDAIHELDRRLDPSRAVLFGVLLDQVEGYDPGVTAQTLAALDFQHPVLVADADFVDRFHGVGWAHVTPVTYLLDEQGRVTAALRGRQTIESIGSRLPDGAVR